MTTYVIDKLYMLTMEHGERRHATYAANEIHDALFDEILEALQNEKLYRLEMEISQEDKSMSVFYESGRFHIGVVDLYNDTNYYYNNGSGDTTLLDVDGEMFETRMVGTDRNLLWKAIREFAQQGTLSAEIAWIVD